LRFLVWGDVVKDVAQDAVVFCLYRIFQFQPLNTCR
jgi:hypothetical protein